MGAPKSQSARTPIDALWLFLLMLLLAIGLIGNFSSSSLLSLRSLGDEYYYLKRHLIFLLLGVGVFFVGWRLSLDAFRRFTYPLLFASIFLLWLTLIPGIGHRAGGASRWIDFGLFTFQPAEFFKLTLILYLAHSLAKKQEAVQDFSKGFLPHLAIAGLGVIPLLAQPDFGSIALTVTLTLIMLFLAGARWSHLFLIGSGALVSLAALVIYSPYRVRRVVAFLDPWADPQNKGYQIIQSMVAFYNGGLTGVGLGNSQGKLFYLPAAHTDFILAVFAEEAGFIGVAFILLLFVLFFARSVKIAGSASDSFKKFLVLGFSFQIILQTMINALVVTGSLPTKGLTLPFISSGGSSLLVLLLTCGLIANVSSNHRVA